MNTPKDASATTCKIIAPSSRHALRLVREQLGPDAIVVSSTVTPDGVEIVAMREAPAPGQAASAPVAQAAAPSPLPAAQPPEPVPSHESEAGDEDDGHGDHVLREIHSMRGMIEEQLAGLAWNKAQRRDPLRGQLLRTLLGAGFSARLARDLLENLPTGLNHASGMDHVRSAMASQMPMLEDEDALMNEGGVYALMGPTGVGKTTTTAKLAARCVMRFGAEKLALVTTDSYRIGAFEQLRIYGQILGVSVHAVKDAVDLEVVLSDLRDKHMVLIDTVGMSQRDRAVSEQISMLCGASRPVKRLLLLNASSHGDTLNEVVNAYRRGDKTGNGTGLSGCIFTKVDEATHPGALIDTVIRHQLPVYYISSGQKVPEHLMLGNRGDLIDSVFKAKSQSAWFVPGEADLDERPAAERAEARVAAAAAVSERLRSQCQQLIRALAHDARELTTNAAALSAGGIGFDETRSLWRKLPDEQVSAPAMARTQLSQLTQLTQASADSKLGGNDYLLVARGEIKPAADKDSAPAVPVTVLLSERDGLPFAALGEPARQSFALPLVHLFAGLPDAGWAQLPSEEQHWLACVPASLRIVVADNGRSTTLTRLAAGLSFGARKAVVFRGKRAWQSEAEVQVSLPATARPGDAGASASPSVLRCVVRRMVDADSGKALSHSYLLASQGLLATAAKMAQWAAWRAAAEPYFKLFNQGVAQLGEGGELAAGALSKHVQVAGQTASTVFRLQHAQGAWAESARKVLAQLAGRSLRAGRPVPGAALFEGMGKLCVLLDALESDGATSSSQSDLAPLQR